MEMDLAPARGERGLLCGRDDLVAKEDDAVFEQRLMNRAERLGSEILRKIDAADLCAHATRERADFQAMAFHETSSAAS